MKQVSSEIQDENADEVRSNRIREVLKCFRTVVKSVKRHSEKIKEQCGVSGAELWVLSELLNKPGMRSSDLARVLAIHQSTLSNLLDKLDRKKLIWRERGRTDQRVVRLYLTESGEEVITHAPGPSQGVLIDALRHLSDEVVVSLETNLGILVQSMKLKDETLPMDPLSPID
ncbi:MAG: MarR family winged helix-turn-helix transcriptional regulator [Proteobacteria bacterium]|nr:MarR family winged helix-turn-helix transcriptional regulator [Pseudomonadota bacterium]MDE3207538.1 winged helix-turn-helix transcriptional regulator [Pseudomonadota bacterium]